MNQADHIEMQAGDWLASRDSDRWSERDQAALDAWIAASPAHRIAYLRLESVWRRADRLASLRGPERDDEPALEPHVIGRRGRAANLPHWRAVAALLVVAGAGWFVAQTSVRSEADSYVTALGNRRAVTLVDGSHLLLNTDTRLQIDLGRQRRLVRLDRGEAYFDVAHDAARPFVIDAGNSRITVLGTRFSVKRDADEVAVLVTEGRVKVEPINVPAGTAAIFITRNDALIAKKNDVLVAHKSDTQLANELSWREGQLVFDQVTLAQAASEFNRYNRQKLVITDAETGKIVLGGRFDTNNVGSFARLLHQGLGLRVDEQADAIRVSR
jgi:transmembrane sensor